ncbi:hypothetical protein L596_014402 [Steinernema carpocapsae]|uniref:Uncharacterized protein n=1 Tax=Steinernema carpocapsae TaxID=34508 RepID=A0A4U5NCR8_STECR|nr:hypothetical protein L596_014402 [Steinernema carpocapsae]
MRSPILWFVFVAGVAGIRHLTCHFTMRDFFGNYVNVMRKCPPGTSYCASRVINSTGWNSLVIDYFDWYCENENNVSRHLRTTIPPTEGCYTYSPTRDEHVCFCDRDFCNEKASTERIFLRHVEREEKFHAQRMREMALQEQLIRQQKILQHPHRKLAHQIEVPPPFIPQHVPSQPPPNPPFIPQHAPPPPPPNPPNVPTPPPPPHPPLTRRIPHAKRLPHRPVEATEATENQFPLQPADIHRITVTRVGDAENPDEEVRENVSDAYADDIATLAPIEPEVRELTSAEMASKHSAPKQSKSRTRRIQ